MSHRNDVSPHEASHPHQASRLSRLVFWGRQIIALFCRLYLGIVFIYASLHKIAHPKIFAIDVATYDMLPLAAINLFAIGLPYLEIVTGVMFVIGLRTRAAALLISAMMLMFLIAVSYALYSGIDTSCGCFASQSMESDPIGFHTVLRDVAWLSMSLFVLVFDTRPLGLDRWLAKEKTA
jgi:uncharacterized membrane protein YphA (DoxX/SURF4 family)